MKRIEVFESNDGKIYRTLEGAVNRDLQLQFREWYENNELFSDRRVSFEDLWDWLTAHKTEVVQALETID
jgi:hypothetical protein